MTHKHFYMGAINKSTDEYVFPLHAVKTDNYKCPVCENDIIFKSGKINRKHYSHKAKSNCCYYSHPSESQIHKDGKRLMKKMLDDREKLMIWRNCKYCGDDIEVLSLINYADKMECREEFAFQHNSNKRIADVVLLEDDNINFIFEIFKTHRTDEINRPHDKWCEINAEELIINTMEESNRNDAGEIEIECVRDIFCDDCVKRKKKESDNREADRKRQELIHIKRMICRQEAIRTSQLAVADMINTLTDSQFQIKLGSLHHTTAVSRWAYEIIQNNKRKKEHEKQQKIIEEARMSSLREEWDKKAKEEAIRREEKINGKAIRLINDGKIKELFQILLSRWGKYQIWKRNIKKELLIWFPNIPLTGIFKFVRPKSVSEKAKTNKINRMREFKKYGYI